MSFRALLTVSLVLNASLLGCSVRDANPVVHKPPVETQPPTPVPNENEQGVATQSVLVLGTTDYATMLEQAQTGEQIYSRVVAPLAAVLLNPQVYQSPTAVSSLTFFRALRDFNTALLKLARVDSARLNSSGILDRYKEAIYVDCRLDLQGTCSNITTYAREAHFARVLVLIAKVQTDVLEYYRVLYTAMERGRADMDQELNYLYLDRHQELARVYLREQEAPSELDLEILRMHARVLQNILADFDPSAVSREQMDQLMARFNPWDVSRRTGGMSAVGVDKLLNWASSGYMYADAERTRLDDKFKGRVEEILNGTDENYGMGILAIYKQIQASPSKGILTNFGLAPNIEANEYAYLVDRIFYLHFTIEDATILWNNTNKDKAALFRAVNDFVRLQIANMIVWTNGEMNRFFEEKGEAYKDLIQLLRGAVNNSLAMHATWDRTLNRIATLINFVDREYGKVDPFLLPDSDEYKQFAKSVSGLRHNIKMLSVYPNMMMIVYLMAKKNFQATINTFFGPVTITPYDVINWFFLRVMEPWFSFGTDGSKLSEVELLYAIHFAMVTETFSTFRDNPVIPVNEAEFFQTVTEKLVNEIVQLAIDDVKKVNQFENANTKLLREAMAACTEERMLQALEQPGEMRPRRYVRVIAYEDMNTRYANGFPNANESQLGTLTRFYGSTLGIASTLTRMTTTVESRLLFVRNMLGIMKDYLEQTNASTEAVDEAYRKEVDKYIEVRNEYVRSVYNQLNRYGDCAEVLMRHERELRNRLYDAEEAYLGLVFDRVAELNALFESGKVDEAQQKAEQFNAELAPPDNSGLPQDYVDRGGYDKYVANSDGYYFNYHKLDAFLRMRRNLRQLTPNTEVTLPNFDKLTEYQQPSPTALVMGENADREQNRALFIADGMRKFMNYTGSTATTLNSREAFQPAFMIDKLDMLARLYRLGPVGQNGELNCTENCQEVTAEQVIRHAIATVREADINEYDQKIMDWVGADDLYDDKFWARIAIEEGNRRHLGLLDLTLQRIAADSSDSLHAGLNNYFMDLTKKYYDTEMSVGNFFYEPRSSIKDLIKRNYSGYVADYENKVEAFMAAYEDLRKEPDLRVDAIRRNRRDTIRVNFQRGPNGEELPVYITNERKTKYFGLVNIFHERTSGEFKRP